MFEHDLESLAPIVLFAYNRPSHTKKTLDALAANHLAAQSRLIVYVDGLKAGATDTGLLRIKQVESIVQAENRFRSITIHISETNKGLAASIIQGVSETLSQYDQVIVLEDDHVTSPYFLQFMNGALSMYREQKEVACISGYIYPVSQPLPETFFIKGADCWGWATWRRAWKIFEPDGKMLLEKLIQSGKMNDFDFDNSYPYSTMLQDQISGKNNSWAIRWYASAYLAGMFTLYPGISYLRNIGFDGTGTHSGRRNFWNSDLINEKHLPEKIEVVENTQAKAIIADYFKGLQSRPLVTRAIGMVGKLLNRFR